MSFIIRNISGSIVEIDDIGIRLEIGEDVDLAQEASKDIAISTDLIDAIQATDIIVLDPLDGSSPLTLPQSVEAIEVANDTHFRIRGGELSQLDDVSLTVPSDGFVLTYNQILQVWEPQPSGGAGSGEANTASNLGIGQGWFAQKVGADLEFKSITTGANIAISSSPTEINLVVDEASLSHLNIGDIGTNTHPVIDSHIADISIHVPQSTIDEAIDAKRDKIAGFENRDDVTFTFNELTGVATITPVGAEFTFWSNNTKYTYSTPQTTTLIPDVKGRIIYFDDFGVLVNDPTPNDGSTILRRDCIVGAATITVSDSKFNQEFDLRYDVDMDPETRFTFVITHGTLYNNGLALTNIDVSGNGDIDTHAQMSMDDGQVSLADVIHSTTDDNQSLLFPAQIPIGYLFGTEYRIKEADDFPMVYTGTVGTDYLGTRLPYNRIINGVGELIEVNNNDYVLIHIFASLGVNESIIGIMGQHEYSTQSEARLGAKDEIEGLLISPNAQRYYTPVGSIIAQTSLSYSNVPHARWIETDEGDTYVDLRLSKASLSGGSLGTSSFREEEFNVFNVIDQRLKFDLSNTSPFINKIVTFWPKEDDVDFKLVPEYKLFAEASEDLNTFDEVSLDINGKIQKFPQISGESSTDYTTRSVTHNIMEYISNNTGIVAFADATANTIFFQAGSEALGVVTWGAEVPFVLTGNVVELNGTKIDQTRCGFSVVTDDGKVTIFTISYTGILAVIDDSLTLADGSVITADLSYNVLNHLVIGMVAGITVKNEFLILTVDGIMSSQKPSQPMGAPANVTKVQVTSENDNIIVLCYVANNVHVAESKYRYSGSQNKRYSIHASPQQILGADFDTIAGVEAFNSAVFLQARKTSDQNWYSYFCPYTSGIVVDTENTFGVAIIGKVARLLNSASGIGYNLVINSSNKLEIYQGNANNPLLGFELIHTSGIVLTNSTTYDELRAIFFESTFSVMIQGDIVANDTIYFISGSSTQADNYIGNIAQGVLQGEIGEIYLGLPVINQNINHTPGEIFNFGPYKYQAITKHQVVIVLEEVIPLVNSTLTLSSLSDVQSTPPLDNSIIQYSAGSPAQWEVVQPDHTDLLNIGTNTHADIDTHIADLTNPHDTSMANLIDTTVTAPADGEALIYNASSNKWENIILAVGGSGRIVQVVFGPIADVTSTASIPNDTTTPLISEGVEIWSQNIQPQFIDSDFRLNTSLTFDIASNNTEIIIAFFRDSICIGTGIATGTTKKFNTQVSITVYDDPATLATVTYSCRVGKTSGTTWYINRTKDSAGALGSTMQSQAFTVEEIGIS